MFTDIYPNIDVQTSIFKQITVCSKIDVKTYRIVIPGVEFMGILFKNNPSWTLAVKV